MACLPNTGPEQKAKNHAAAAPDSAQGCSWLSECEQAGDLDHAAMHAIRSCQVRKIQPPDPFPDFRDMPQAFRLINQLAGSRVGIWIPNRSRAAFNMNKAASRSPTFSRVRIVIATSFPGPVVAGLDAPAAFTVVSQRFELNRQRQLNGNT